MQTARYRGIFGLLSLIFGLLALPLAAQEVDKAELERIDRSGIVFINFEGQSTRNESVEEIAGIGRELGRAVRGGAQRAGSEYRYFVIHSVTAPEGNKLDADIIGLGIDVGVNHIRNLREIIRGYLEEAYEYSSRDARLLAEFITIYNAVYRGNWKVFTDRYKTAVVGHLTPEKAGLSVRYDQWPGQTLMVIPLSLATPGRLGAIDTTPLTDRQVIDEVRKQEDLGIETRKDMIDLKERESEEAAQKALLEREAIRDEERRIAQEKRALEEEARKQEEQRARIEQERRAVEEAKRDESSDKEDVRQREEEVQRQEERLLEEQRTIEEKKDEIARDEEKVEERRQEAQREEDLADKKREEAQEERKDVAEDIQTIIRKDEEKTEEIIREGQLGLALLYPNSSVARFVLIDKRDGSELRRSAIDTIQGRSVLRTANGLYAIAGDASGTVRIVAVDPLKLEVLSQSTDAVHVSSLLWAQGNDLFAVITLEGKNWFARFDKDLRRVARSQIAVHPWTSPVFLEGGLLSLQDERGQPLVLRASDLAKQQ